MQGAITRRVQVEHSTFSVHHDGRKAVAIRRNVEFGPQARGVMDRGYRAIQMATGCEIVPRTFDGDPALMRADIHCPDGWGPDVP